MNRVMDLSTDEYREREAKIATMRRGALLMMAHREMATRRIVVSIRIPEIVALAGAEWGASKEEQQYLLETLNADTVDCASHPWRHLAHAKQAATETTYCGKYALPRWNESIARMRMLASEGATDERVCSACLQAIRDRGEV